MLSKLKTLPTKIKVALTTAMMMCTTSALAFADEGTAMTMDVAQLETITNSITGVINIAIILKFLGAIFAIAAVFALMWFGVRKAVSVIMGSVRKGKIGG